MRQITLHSIEMELAVVTRLGRGLMEGSGILDSLISPGELNISICTANCTFPRGRCINGSCQCEFVFSGKYCESFSSLYVTTFASLSYLLFLIASVQLILCMICDAHDGVSSNHRWKKAFRFTIRKCLLGTVIAAMGTRAIYFTVQHFSFPDKWTDILHDAYYPSFITAFSVLICFWAEVFYNNLEVSSQSNDVTRNRQYFLYCTVFNVMVYLLLLADIIATPLVNDVEQNRKSIVIGAIFIFLLLLMLIGFLHYGVRLFFKPDWRSLSDVFKINLRQQTYSCVGVVSNALMQCLIIVLLLLNLASRFGVVDFLSLYISKTVIHTIELGLPIWFCCSLWNFKRPSNLWLLNPSLLLQAAKKYQGLGDPSERSVLVDTKMSKSYGSVQNNNYKQQESSNNSLDQFQDCWICLDKGDVTDFFKPCKCSKVHRQCLTKWISERTIANTLREAYKCQICKTKYHIKRKPVCIPKEMSLKQWLIGITLLTLFVGVSCLAVFIPDIKPNPVKALLAFTIIVLDAIILKLIGFCLYWAYKHMISKEIIILDNTIKHQSAILPQPPIQTLPLNDTHITPSPSLITITTQSV